MNTLADVIKSTLVARETIGVMLIVLCAVAVQRNRPFFREVWNDPAHFWRVIARLAVALALVTLAWVALVDDWLQLVAEPYRLSMPWDYQRVVFDPVDPTLRAVSVGLILASLAALACLFARHVGGYGLQVVALALSAMIWTPIFIMNQRLNAMIVQGAEASETLPEVLGLSAFWLVRSALGVVTIGATLMTGMMLLALVATVLLDLFGLRRHRITHEADGFFTELQRRAALREDIPLKTLWRPIRRPL